MNQETKICQNCQKDFVIEVEDFDFYNKIKVPPPTFCPECRWTRNMLWRNERSLYKRRCDVPGHSEEIISMFSPAVPVRIYDRKYWWSDNWDPLAFGRNYDFSKSFFEQFKQLFSEVPHPNLINSNSVNSDYCNLVQNMKNCYLCFGASFAEETLYSTWLDYAKDCVDNFWATKNELCYEAALCRESYNLKFSAFCHQCLNSFFLWDCRGCADCFCCVGLRSKSYHIFNKPYSKEDYLKKVKEYDLGSFENIQCVIKQFQEFRLAYPYQCARILYSNRASGDNLNHAKNVLYSFDAMGEGLEDSKYVFTSFGSPVKDSHSTSLVGFSSSLVYDSLSTLNANNVLFSVELWVGHHIQYVVNCHNCNNCFACIGLRNKQYCILNKQYSKEEYEALVPKIIEHMNTMPYIDKKGRVYKYGEFFPTELSPFCYNETIAQEYFPLTKDQALEQGYSWKDPEPRNYQIDLTTDQLPDNIKDVSDDIVGKVIECVHQGKCQEQCTEAFRIIEPELAFYRRMNLPLPRLCPNCRHYQRLKQRNPLKLWKRQCQAPGCANTFETSYAPDRPEIVYCEACYLKEVV